MGVGLLFGKGPKTNAQCVADLALPGWRSRISVCAVLVAILTAPLCLSVPVTHAQTESPAASSAIVPTSFISQVRILRENVAEFRWLADWARARGKRVFLAGGTASGFGVYVKQFMEQEAAKAQGKPLPYFASRFTWNYFDIYRSTQDADIVLDGNEEDAQALETDLMARFHYMQGSKSTWEVRLLSEPRGAAGTPGYKDPLVEPSGKTTEFQKQHSDSYSTGLIELTDTDHPVRDVSDWKNEANSQYLRDLIAGQVTYYYRATHKQTKRFREGFNPEILSVIRVLTKSFQYGGTISPESRKWIQQVVNDFNPSDSLSSYAADQIRKNSLKLFWHSRDVEHSWNVLEELGLRKKLIKMGGDAATWLDREPLRTKPLGTSGVTAESLGIDIVSHETNSFLAFENITFSLRGFANVFQSRDGHTGEAAVHGDGFYVRMGRKGARQTGLTIRFKMNPLARLGSDFLKSDDYVIVRNRAALEVIDETIELSPLHFVQFLATSDFTDADRGVHEKMKIRLQAAWGLVKADEIEQMDQFIGAEISYHRFMQPGKDRSFGESQCFPAVVTGWFSQSLDKSFPSVTKSILAELDPVCRVVAFDKFFEGNISNKELKALFEESLKVEVQKKYGLPREAVQAFWENYIFGLAAPRRVSTSDADKFRHAKFVAAFTRKALAKKQNLIKTRTALRVLSLGILTQEGETDFYHAFTQQAPAERAEFISSVILQESVVRHPEWVDDFFALGRVSSVQFQKLITQSVSHWNAPAFIPHLKTLVERIETIAELGQFLGVIQQWSSVDLAAPALVQVLQNPVLAGKIRQHLRMEDRSRFPIAGLDGTLKVLVDKATPGPAQEQVLELVGLFKGLGRLPSLELILPYVHRHPKWILPWFDYCAKNSHSTIQEGIKCTEFIEKIFGGPNGVQFKGFAEQLLSESTLTVSYFDTFLTKVFLGPEGHTWTKRADYLDADFERRRPDGLFWTDAAVGEVMALLLKRVSERPEFGEVYDRVLRYVLSRAKVETIFEQIVANPPPHFRREWFDLIFRHTLERESGLKIESEAKYFSLLQRVERDHLVERGLDPLPTLNARFDAWVTHVRVNRNFHGLGYRIAALASEVFFRRPDLDNLDHLKEWLIQISILAADNNERRVDDYLATMLQNEFKARTQFAEVKPVLDLVLRSPARGMRVYAFLKQHPWTEDLPELKTLFAETVSNPDRSAQVNYFLLYDFDAYSSAARMEILRELLANVKDLKELAYFMGAVHWKKFPSTQSADWVQILLEVADRIIHQYPVDMPVDFMVWNEWAKFMAYFGHIGAEAAPESVKLFEDRLDLWIKRAGYIPTDFLKEVLNLPAYAHRVDWLILAVQAPHLSDQSNAVYLRHYLEEITEHLLSRDSVWLQNAELLKMTGGWRITLDRLERALGIFRSHGLRAWMRKCSDYLLLRKK